MRIKFSEFCCKKPGKWR